MTTQNDCKRSRNPMKMVSDVIFKTFRPFLVIWGLFRPFLANFGPKFKIVLNWSCDHSKWLQERQKSIKDGFRWVQVISRHFVCFWGHKSHFWARTQNCCKLVLWHLKTITRRAEIWWRWFRMSLSRYLGHLEKKMCYFGAHCSHFWPQNDKRWPEMTWTHWNCHLKPFLMDFCLSCGHFEWSHDQLRRSVR